MSLFNILIFPLVLPPPSLSLSLLPPTHIVIRCQPVLCYGIHEVLPPIIGGGTTLGRGGGVVLRTPIVSDLVGGHYYGFPKEEEAGLGTKRGYTGVTRKRYGIYISPLRNK